jgi:hypothetical protein
LTLKVLPDTLTDSKEAKETTAAKEQGIGVVQAELSAPEFHSFFENP